MVKCLKITVYRINKVCVEAMVSGMEINANSWRKFKFMSSFNDKLETYINNL